MADFCGPCQMKIFDANKVYDIEEDIWLELLCEGCGYWVLVDRNGTVMKKDGVCTACGISGWINDDGTCSEDCYYHMLSHFCH